MYRNFSVGTVIPARNEEDNVGHVVAALLALRERSGKPIVDDVVVCDNGSTDATRERASRAGARVVVETRRGYGAACLAALAALRAVDVVLFVDADQAFHIEQSTALLAAVADGADMAIGSRTLGCAEGGALSVPQVAGNRVAGGMIRLLWGKKITDLGPFRAIRADALRRLKMRDMAYGWTVEMQIKAIQVGLRVVEVPVDTRRRRFGKSKVGGTLKGVVGASIGIMSMIIGLWVRGRKHGPRE